MSDNKQNGDDQAPTKTQTKRYRPSLLIVKRVCSAPKGDLGPAPKPTDRPTTDGTPDRPTDRPTDRRTDRPTDRRTNRPTVETASYQVKLAICSLSAGHRPRRTRGRSICCQKVGVNLRLYISPSVSVCLRLSPSVSVCLRLSPSVSVCLRLSPSVSVCLRLPSSVSVCVLCPK